VWSRALVVNEDNGESGHRGFGSIRRSVLRGAEESFLRRV
jgi:hypothetical protein